MKYRIAFIALVLCVAATVHLWPQQQNFGGVVPLTTGTTGTVNGQYAFYVCTSTCTVTVPVPSPGVQFCVMNDDNVSTVITLAAIPGVQYENTARTSYKSANTSLASGGAAKDSICIVGRDATHYLSLNYNGTWS